MTKDELSLEKFVSGLQSGLLVFDGEEVVTRREVFHPDSHFVVVHEFAIEIENITDNAVHCQFG